jgi:hypothetical protein
MGCKMFNRQDIKKFMSMVGEMVIKLIPLFFIIMFFTASCTSNPMQPDLGEQAYPTHTTTTITVEIHTATASPSPSLTPPFQTETPKPTRTPKDEPHIGMDDPKPTITPRITPSPTSVPLGLFALLIYSPMTMTYDAAKWKDESHYDEMSLMQNYLQAINLRSCKIGVQGPTAFDPSTHTSEIVSLGDVKYEVKTFEDEQTGSLTAFYIAYEIGGLPLPLNTAILVITASNDEWSECKTLGEVVLATLRH